MLRILVRRPRGASGVVRIGGALALILAATATPAATYVVNTLGDGAVGSTTCTGGADPCNLRDAIDLAHHGTGTDTVSFQAGLTGTLQLHTEEIDIAIGLTITGPGSDKLTIDGQGARIFNINMPAGANLAANAVAISKLRFIGGTSAGNGGAIVIGDANVTLSDSSFSGNRAGFGASGSGGAVYSAPVTSVNTTLSVQRCRFDTNNATLDGGALATTGLASAQLTDIIADNNNRSIHAGGAIYAQAQTITITGGRIATNICGKVAPPVTPCAGGGGGLALEGKTVSATLAVNGLRVEDNSSLSTGGIGGGVMLHQFATAILDRVQISGNGSGDAGGGVQMHNVALTLRNSTLAGNHVYGNAGGGGLALGTAGSANLDNVTIAGNDTVLAGGGLIVGAGTSASVHNSVLANNTANGLADDAAGTLTLNYSLLKTPGTASVSGANNLAAGVDPQLGALAMYGGSSLTMLPAVASPVLNQGDPATAPGTDQRGLPRVTGGRAELGAVERQSPEDIIFRNNFE
jgi:predicted outer membrane repeat protein